MAPSQADLMGTLAHTGITAAATLTVKTTVAALSECITMAKKMYNAPTELEAWEEQIDLIKMVVDDVEAVKSDVSSSTAVRSAWWRLDSKVREVETFIREQLMTRHTHNGAISAADIELQDLEGQVTGSSYENFSAKRLAWSQNKDKVLVFRTELKEAQELLRFTLANFNTTLTLKIANTETQLLQGILQLDTHQRENFRDIHRKVDDIDSLSFHRHEANQSSLEFIDTRLKRMEQGLQQLFQASQRHRHETNNQTLVQASRLPSTTTFRIIKPGYLFYDEDGETKMDLVGLKDAKFANADNKSKLQMIEYLKNLRLVLWLLKKQNYLSYTEHILTRVFKSGLASQASLTSKWLCSISCGYLIDILPERAEMLPTLLPWSMRKDWLQHIFDSMEDRDMDGEIIMELVVSRWSYFPLPEGDLAEYYLRIPPSLEIGEFSQHLAVHDASGSSRDEPFQDIIEAQSLADENLEAQTYFSEPRLPGSVIHSSNYSLIDSQGFPMPQTTAFTSADCHINLPPWEDEVSQSTALDGSHQQETHELLNRALTQIVEALARSTTEASTGETKKWSTDSELVKKRSRLRSKTESSDEEDAEAPWPRFRFACPFHKRCPAVSRQLKPKLRTSKFTRCQLCHAEMVLPPNKQSSKCAGCVETERRLEFRMRSRAQKSSRISAKQVR